MDVTLTEKANKIKFVLIFLFSLLFAANSSAVTTTATLATVQGIPGDNVAVPLTVTNFNSVSAITIRIKFTRGVLTFINLTNLFPGFTPTVGHTDTTVSIVWSSISPITITNGTLANLNFQYHGTSTALTFYKCQVSTFGPPPGNLVVTYTNGAVNPNQDLPNKAQIGTRGGTNGSTVSVPLYYPVFLTNAGALTQQILYDITKLTFLSITPLGNLTGAIGNATDGVVHIVWSNIAGANIGTPGDTILMNFTYTGTTITPLTFTTGCVISTVGGANIPVSYFNGAVVPSTLSLENITIGSGQSNCYNAQIIHVAGSGTYFNVEDGGSAILVAGQQINLYPGTVVQPGGYLWAYISTPPLCSGSGSLAENIMDVAELDGIRNPEPGFFSVYPNPFSEKFTLELASGFESSYIAVRLSGMMGNEILKEEISGTGKRIYSLSGYPAGMYILRVVAGERSGTVKIIKQ